MEKVIAHYMDGQIKRGLTTDFKPSNDWFNLLPVDYTAGSKPSEIRIPELKGLFFVRDLSGNPSYRKQNLFDSTRMVPGRKVRVVFHDGEVLQGHTQGYWPDRPGFFVIPADAHSNTERCYIVTAATREVTYL